jgi:hypothetical protein
MRSSGYIISALALVNGALAWGELGHRTVAYIAYSQLTEPTRKYVENVLAMKKGEDISDIAIWADAVRREKKYSAPWHYIGRGKFFYVCASKQTHMLNLWKDQQDAPPTQCSINYPQDCSQKEGCIVSALGNHTRIFVDSSPSLSANRKEALSFVIHFFGDIHQPLHAENMFRGGNDLPVCFRGNCDKWTNLHSVWDDFIPRTMANVKIDPVTGEPPVGEEKAVAKKWAEELFKRRGPGSPYERGCVDVTRVEFCATSWAVESNGLVCSYVMSKGIDWLRGRDLGGDYYTGAIPIVEGQIVRAGVRLADYLEAMVIASKELAAERSISGALEL